MADLPNQTPAPAHRSDPCAAMTTTVCEPQSDLETPLLPTSSPQGETTLQKETPQNDNCDNVCHQDPAPGLSTHPPIRASSTASTPTSSSSTSEEQEPSHPHSLNNEELGPRFCARLCLGFLYLGLGVAMLLLLAIEKGWEHSRMPPRQGMICSRSLSLCALVFSWVLVLTYLMIQGVRMMATLRFRQRRRRCFVRDPSQSFSAALTPLAVFIVYLVLAYLYVDVRNSIVYGHHHHHGNVTDDDAYDGQDDAIVAPDDDDYFYS